MKNKLHHLIGLTKIHRIVTKNYHNRFLGVIYDKRTLKNSASRLLKHIIPEYDY